MNYCNHCGAPLPEGAVNCPACNAPVTNNAQTTTPPAPQQNQAPTQNGTVPPPAVPNTGTPAAYSQPYQTSPVYPGPPYQSVPPIPPPPQKPKKTWLVVTIIVGVLLAVFLIFSFAIRSFLSNQFEKEFQRLTDQVNSSALADESNISANMELTNAYSLIELNFKTPSNLVWLSAENIERGAVFETEEMDLQVNYSMALVDAEEYYGANLDYYRDLAIVSSVGEPEFVTIDGKEWLTSVITFNSNTNLQEVDLYLYYNETFQYSITLIYRDINAKSVGELILSSVTFTPIENAVSLIGVPPDFDENVDAATKNFDAAATAATIVGEWEGGQGGYMVFYSDNRFEWFSSNEKDRSIVK